MGLTFSKMWDVVWSENERNIRSLLGEDPKASYLDLGCDEGSCTIERANKLGTSNIFGIDIVLERLSIAEIKGIKVKNGSLNDIFPYQDDSFDVITANQVIEHLYNTDVFISEMYRVLKPGGYAIVSTENASSWHNIASLVLGFQMFSLTNISAKGSGVGNPFALHRGEIPKLNSWQHTRIFAYKGLLEIFELHGFNVERILGSGYLPFWHRLAWVDKRHASVLTVKIRKDRKE